MLIIFIFIIISFYLNHLSWHHSELRINQLLQIRAIINFREIYQMKSSVPTKEELKEKLTPE